MSFRPSKPEKTRPPAGLSPQARLRPQIESALAAGVAPQTMTLRVTLRDAAHLSRDPAIPLHDIRFEGGTMYFLNVRVEKGGVAASSLEIGDQGPVASARPPAA